MRVGYAAWGLGTWRMASGVAAAPRRRARGGGAGVVPSTLDVAAVGRRDVHAGTTLSSWTGQQGGPPGLAAGSAGRRARVVCRGPCCRRPLCRLDPAGRGARRCTGLGRWRKGSWSARFTSSAAPQRAGARRVGRGKSGTAWRGYSHEAKVGCADLAYSQHPRTAQMAHLPYQWVVRDLDRPQTVPREVRCVF